MSQTTATVTPSAAGSRDPKTVKRRKSSDSALPKPIAEPAGHSPAPSPPADAISPDKRGTEPGAGEKTPTSPAVAESLPRQVDIPIAEAEVPDLSAVRPTVATPKRPAVDIAARLRQPIVRFEQSKAVPLKELLLVVEEMVGVPVGFDPDAPESTTAPLERTVSLRLQNTTVGGLLQSLAEKGGLSYEIQEDAIRLRVR